MRCAVCGSEAREGARFCADRVAPLRAQTPAARALLKDLYTRDPALAAQLDEDIRRGVNDRREDLGADTDE